MNIVTPYPTNIPINTVNVSTELARRDNQLREMIAKPTATEAGVAERGVATERDKSKTPQQQQQGAFEVNLRQAEEHQKITERQGQHGEGGQHGEEQQKQDQHKQQEAEKRLTQVEKEVQRQEQREVQQLKSRDTEVRTHEQAHAAVGGRYAGSPTYEFKRGPDGRNYAVGGEVQIDASAVPGDPKATIEKMQTVRAAALAPAEPSGQDRRVASEANQIMSEARAEQIKLQAEQAKAENETTKAEQQAAQTGSEPAQATQAAAELDPFVELFGETESSFNQKAQGAGSVGEIFGAAGAPGGERRGEVNANRQAAEQRNADVVARAGRIQSFYARSTVPREGGFSQFA